MVMSKISYQVSQLLSLVVCVDGPDATHLVDSWKRTKVLNSNLIHMSETLIPEAKTKKCRTYLSKTEKDVLQEFLPMWTEKENKRSQEAFINSTVIPRIQQLNLPQFSSDIIGRDKEAKKLWEKRIQASVHLL